MTPLRLIQIRTAIASLLDQTGARLYPESHLFRDLVALRLVVPAITLAEFEEALRKMELAHQVLRYRSEEEGLKSKLTDEGRAELLT